MQEEPLLRVPSLVEREPGNGKQASHTSRHWTDRFPPDGKSSVLLLLCWTNLTPLTTTFHIVAGCSLYPPHLLPASVVPDDSSPRASAYTIQAKARHYVAASYWNRSLFSKDETYVPPYAAWPEQPAEQNLRTSAQSHNHALKANVQYVLQF